MAERHTGLILKGFPAWLQAAVAALADHRAEARHAVRVAAATLIAYFTYKLLSLPQGYWAVFTVVIVMQGSIGGTLSASIDRMKGTLLGAVIGGIAAWLHPRTPVGFGAALAVSVGISTFAAVLRPTFKVAPVTAVIMLISPTAGADPLITAVYRVIEIALGSVIGVAASVLILPARSNALAAESIRRALEKIAVLTETYAQALRDNARLPDIYREQADLRAALGAVESAMADAARERSSRLGDHRISDAVPRTLWRVRNDSVTVARAVAPFPVALDRLRTLASEGLSADAAMMRRCGDALLASRTVERGLDERPLRDLEAEIERARISVGEGLSFDAVGHVYAITYALESLQRNLNDLADRIDETARGRAESPVAVSV